MTYFFVALGLAVAALGLALREWVSKLASRLALRFRPARLSWLRFPSSAAVVSEGTAGDLPFIGRETELTQLFDIVNNETLDVRLVLVSGPSGSGKRALLEEFARYAPGRARTASIGPLINLAYPRELDVTLADVATMLERGGLRPLLGFRRKLDSYRAKRSGRETAAERRVGFAVQAAKVVSDTLLPPVASKVIGLGADEAQKTIAEEWLVAPDLPGLIDAFAKNLVEVVREPDRQIAVLLFENYDSRPDDADAQAIRDRLVPALQGGRVRVLTTIQRELRSGSLADRTVTIPLQFFDREHTAEIVRRHMGIEARNAALIDDIWRKSEGSPELLTILHDYFQHHREERSQSSLTPGALTAVATEQASSLLASSTDFQQELIRSVSPLRAFNSELAQAVFDALEIRPAEGEPPPISQLLRSNRGPRRFERRAQGWTFDSPASRDSLLRDFRESDPGRCRTVHLAAAQYYRRTLDRLDGTPPVEPQADPDPAWLYSYQAQLPAARRYADPEYVWCLGNWLYHVLSVERERAFAIAQDQVAEALFAERYAEAQELLRAISEALLTPFQRTRVRLLQQLSAQLAKERYSEARDSLLELDQLGGASPLTKAFESCHRGICEVRLYQFATAIKLFDVTRARIDRQPQDARTLRMACRNAIFRAYSTAFLTEQPTDATQILDEQIARLGGATDPSHQGVAAMPELLAVLYEERASILARFGGPGETDQVLQGYDTALKTLEEIDEPEQLAGLKLTLGRFYLKVGKNEEALRWLREAEAGFRLLSVEAGVRWALLEQMAVALSQENEREVWRLRDAIPDAAQDVAIQLQMGSMYAAAGKRADARTALLLALKLGPSESGQYRQLIHELRGLEEYDAVAEAFDRWDTEPKTADGRLPECVEWRIQFAGTLWSMGREAQAGEQFRRAKAALAPGNGTLEGQPKLQADVANVVRAHLLRGLDDVSEDRLLRLLDQIFDHPVDLQLELFDLLWWMPSAGASADHRVASNGPDVEKITGEHLLGHSSTEPSESVAPAAPDLELSALEHLRLQPWLSSAHEPLPSAPTESKRAGIPAQELAQAEERRREAVRLLSDACKRLDRASPDPRLTTPRDPSYWELRLAEALIEIRSWTEADVIVRGVLARKPDHREAVQLSNRIAFRRSWDRVGQPEERPAIVVEASEDLERWVGETPEGQSFIGEMLPSLRRELKDRIGITIPGIRVRLSTALSPGTVLVFIHEIPCFVTVLPQHYLLALSPGETSRFPAERIARLPWDGGMSGVWLEEAAVGSMAADGATLWDPRGIIIACLASVLVDHAGELLTTTQVGELAAMPEQTSAPVDLRRLAALLRALLRERVPVTNLNAIMAALREAPLDLPFAQLIEHTRARLATDVLRPLLDAHGRLAAAEASPGLQQRLGAALHEERLGDWRYCALEPSAAQELLTAMRDEIGEPPLRAFIVPDALRARVRALAEVTFPQLAILSQTEAAGVPIYAHT